MIMKKDVVFSIRMSTEVRDALREAAVKEHRTISSLLNRIITEHLEHDNIAGVERRFEERRKFHRKRILLPSKTYLDEGSSARDLPGVILDISLGGVLLTYPKASEIKKTSLGDLSKFELCFELPSTRERIRFGCDARRMIDTGNEIHVAATFRNPNLNTIKKLQTTLL